MTKQEGLRVMLILNCIQKTSGYNNIKMKLSLLSLLVLSLKQQIFGPTPVSGTLLGAWITVLTGGRSPWP